MLFRGSLAGGDVRAPEGPRWYRRSTRCWTPTQLALLYVIVDFDMIIRGFIRIIHHSMELLVKEMERDLALSSHGSPGLDKTFDY